MYVVGGIITCMRVFRTTVRCIKPTSHILYFLAVVSRRHTPPPPVLVVFMLVRFDAYYSYLVDNLILQAEDRDVVRTYVSDHHIVMFAKSIVGDSAVLQFCVVVYDVSPATAKSSHLVAAIGKLFVTARVSNAPPRG